MTLLPFEKYLIEQGWTPSYGCEKDLNVSYNPYHVFEKGREKTTIWIRQVFINPKNYGTPAFVMETKEVPYAVECRPEGMYYTMFIMPSKPEEFHLVLEGKLTPAQQIMWPV